MIDSTMMSWLNAHATARPVFKPEETGYPALSYRMISWTEDENHDGGCGIQEVHYQIAVHETNHGRCMALTRAVVADLKSKDDALTTEGGIVYHVRVTNVVDLGHYPEWNAWQCMIDAIAYVKE